MAEEEAVLWSGEARLFRRVPGVWPTWAAERLGRGVGVLSESGVTGRVLFEFRARGGSFACHYPGADHVLQPAPCPLGQFAGKCWIWTAWDTAYRPGAPLKEFALLFSTRAVADDFKAAFEEARRANAGARPAPPLAPPLPPAVPLEPAAPLG